MINKLAHFYIWAAGDMPRNISEDQMNFWEPEGKILKQFAKNPLASMDGLFYLEHESAVVFMPKNSSLMFQGMEALSEFFEIAVDQTNHIFKAENYPNHKPTRELLLRRIEDVLTELNVPIPQMYEPDPEAVKNFNPEDFKD